MAMLPMKRLQAVIAESQRDAVLKSLMALGCIEITFPENLAHLAGQDTGLQPDLPPPTDTLDHLNVIMAGITTLDRFCKAEKTSLFPERKAVSLQELSNTARINGILEKARFLNRLTRDIEACQAEAEQLRVQRLPLVPWSALDIPLETPSSQRISMSMGVCPAAVDPGLWEAQLLEAAPEMDLTLVHSDREQHYLFLIFHRSRESEVDALMRNHGFSPVSFKDYRGTAQENISELDRKIQAVADKRKNLAHRLEGLKDFRPDLEFCHDALTLKIHQEEIRNRLLRTPHTVFLEGWLPEDRMDSVSRQLDLYGCACEFSDPLPQDEPPVAFRNTTVTAPFSIISSMYGTPQYRSIVDPTPFMAPFFFIFFGIMVADVAYGTILALVALWVLRQQKQAGFLRQLFTLVLYCGISTIIWGALFGSWFGDSVLVISSMLADTPVTIPPLWFNPLEQPIDMLIFAFALGGLQILTGLGLSGWRQIRSGRWLDAVFDVGFWYLILIGLVMGLLKIPMGLDMAAIGAVGVVFTAGRQEKNPLKRILVGILSLYSVTGYLADVLSYSRLLALGLASSVIASVINTMGTLSGKSVGGILALIIIFIIGHLFNLAINLVGAYVHASRLQYVEFFSKFYESGGQPFRPFAMETKYVMVEKEEH